MANPRTAVQYTDFDGRIWRVSVSKSLFDQGVIGGSPAAATDPGRPGGHRMRRVTVNSRTGHSRVVPIMDEAATLWTTVGTLVTLPVEGTGTAFYSTGFKIDDKPGKQGYAHE